MSLACSRRRGNVTQVTEPVVDWVEGGEPAYPKGKVLNGILNKLLGQQTALQIRELFAGEGTRSPSNQSLTARS